MATKFLRKIILEELSKVLKEAGVGGTSKEGEYSTQFGGPLMPGQQSKSSPKPGDADFMGPEQPTPIPGGISVIKPNQKRLAIKKIQKELKRLGILNTPITGQMDMYTEEALQIAYPGLGDIKKLDKPEKLNRIANFLQKKPLSFGAEAIAKKEEKMSMEVGMTANTKPDNAPVNYGVDPSITKADDEIGAEEKKNIDNLGLRRESIAREIRKLLRKL